MCKKISFWFVIQLVICIILQSFLGISLFSVEKVHAAPGIELIKNGDFIFQSDYWRFKYNSVSGADAYNIVHSKNFATSTVIGIKNTGFYHWAVQLIQDDIPLKKSYKYVLTFDASSTVPRKIVVELRNPVTNEEYFSKVESLDTKNKKYRLEFIMESADDSKAQLVFNMGSVENQIIDNFHEILISKVSLKEMDKSKPKETDEDVEIQSNLVLSRTVKEQVEYGKTENMKIAQEGSFLIPFSSKSKKSREIVLALDNSGAFNSYSEKVNSPFNYGIYASERLNFQGLDAYINGSTYSKDFIDRTSEITITGTCASFTHYIEGKYDINEIKTITEPVEMPQFYGSLVAEAEANAQVFDPEDFPKDAAVPMPGQPEVHIRYEPSQNNFRIVANKKSTFYIDSSMYFKGNLVISLEDIVIKNTSGGFLVADGDISIQGNNLSPAGPDDKIFVYSIGGNIRFQTTYSTLNGIAYAPGNATNPYGGNVIFQGINNSIYGSLAAKNVSFEGHATQFNYGLEGIAEVIEEHFQSFYNANLIRKTAKDLVDNLTGTNTKMGIIQYADSANDNDFTLYDLSVESNSQLLKDKIDAFDFGASGESNMGDALRRANYMLKGPGSGEDSLKQIIMLSGSAPNKWTSSNAEKTMPKLDDGSAIYLAGDGTADSDGSSLAYAKTVGKMANENNIETVFVNFSQDNIEEKLEQVAIFSGAKEVLNTGKHFYSASSASEIEDIFEIIAFSVSEEVSGLLLADIEYEAVLPEGVFVLEAPEDMEVTIVEIGGVQRSKVKGTIKNVELSSPDGIEYTVPEHSFNLKVRFSKPGEIVFSGDDEVLRYIFKVTGINGEDTTKTVEETFGDLIVNVIMTIDIS